MPRINHEQIEQARRTVANSAEGRHDLDAIFEVLQPYLKRIAAQLAKSTGETIDEILERLDWHIDIRP